MCDEYVQFRDGEVAIMHRSSLGSDILTSRAMARESVRYSRTPLALVLTVLALAVLALVRFW